MQIALASLEGPKGEFAHTYESGEFELNDERVRLVENPRVSGRIRRDGAKWKVRGRVQARAELECDRCLQTIDFPIDAEFNLEYVTTEEYARLKAVELSDEDLNLSVFNGEVLDVDEIVREQVLLAVPSQVLCQENCKGLCATCGANLNLTKCGCEEIEIDPRWAELKKMVNIE